MTKFQKSLLLVFLILLVDQAVKIWIKTHMSLYQEYRVFDWFRIYFIENNGMAFGMEFTGEYGKLFLSLFRILAVIGIGWYLYKICQKEEVHTGFVVCVSMVMAGAIGNIIDSAFYGLLFSESAHGVVSTFMGPEGGYASFLHGRVVDMLYFPVIDGYYPDWFPFVGGNRFIFFRPVFNIADASISLGIIAILLFQKKFFPEAKKAEA